MVHGADRALRTMAEEEARRRHAEVHEWATALVDIRLARERAIVLATSGFRHPLRQAGLFDRRADRELLADRAAADDLEREIEGRVRSLSRLKTLVQRPARLLLVLVP
jgi:hypothetical protein